MPPPSGRLTRPSESGRLPLPQEVGAEPAGPEGPEPVAVREADFAERVLSAPVPVVVDFWAESCVPCRLQEPTIRRLARELDGRARVARVNVFECPGVADRYRIKGVPHLLVFDRGEVVLELIGDHSLEQLREHLRRAGIGA